MSDYRVLLYVDNKIRDLSRLVLLKILLEDVYGHEVALLSTLAKPIGVARRWQPHLVLFHHVRHYKMTRVVDTLRACGIQIGVLDTEFLYGDLDEATRQFMRVATSVDRVDLHFTGHPEEKAVLESHFDRALPNTHYVGNMSFDFYVEPLRQLLTPRAEFTAQHGLNLAQPTLLVVTSFPHGHQDPASFDYARMRRTPSDRVRDWRTVILVQKHNKLLMMEAVAQIARRWPDLNILLRPHPFETITPAAMAMYDNYFTAQGVAERIHTVPDGHISHLLNQADVVLQTWSSSSIETWLLDLPIISLSTETFEDPAFDIFKHMLKGGDWVHTPADTLDVLARYLDGGAVPAEARQARQAILGYHLPYPPGQIAHQVASRVDAFLGQTAPRPAFDQLYRKGTTRFHHVLRQLRGQNGPRPLDASWRGWVPPSERVASVEEIDALASQIRSALETTHARSPLADSTKRW